MAKILSCPLVFHVGAAKQYTKMIGNCISTIDTRVSFWRNVCTRTQLSFCAQHGRIWNVWHVNRGTGAPGRNRKKKRDYQVFLHKYCANKTTIKRDLYLYYFLKVGI